MPKISEEFSSPYLRGPDLLNGSNIVSIRGFERRGMGFPEEMKWILFLDPLAKPLVLNKTNARQLADLLGDEMDDWVGRSIELHTVMERVQGKPTQVIRVGGEVPVAPPPKFTDEAVTRLKSRLSACGKTLDHLLAVIRDIDPRVHQQIVGAEIADWPFVQPVGAAISAAFVKLEATPGPEEPPAEEPDDGPVHKPITEDDIPF